MRIEQVFVEIKIPKYMKSTLFGLWFIATIVIAAADSESTALFIASKATALVSFVLLACAVHKTQNGKAA